MKTPAREEAEGKLEISLGDLPEKQVQQGPLGGCPGELLGRGLRLKCPQGARHVGLMNEVALARAHSKKTPSKNNHPSRTNQN